MCSLPTPQYPSISTTAKLARKKAKKESILSLVYLGVVCCYLQLTIIKILELKITHFLFMVIYCCLVLIIPPVAGSWALNALRELPPLETLKYIMGSDRCAKVFSFNKTKPREGGGGAVSVK